MNKPSDSPGQNQFMSEYQSRMQGQDRPEYQVKRASGKKAIAPMY